MTMPNSRTRHVGQALDDDAHRLLTVRDAARFLNVTVSWVYEHIRDDARDRLPALKNNRCQAILDQPENTMVSGDMSRTRSCDNHQLRVGSRDVLERVDGSTSSGSR